MPPSNDVDVFSQDLGFIAVIENSRLAGYNVVVGGGMGMNHGNVETYPKLAELLGFISPDAVNPVGRAVLITQRDYGDRTNRRHARLKYTIEDRGLDWFKGEVERLSGVKFASAHEFEFPDDPRSARMAPVRGWDMVLWSPYLERPCQRCARLVDENRAP